MILRRGQFSQFGTMTVARQNHTAIPRMDGRVFIAGGVGRLFVSGTAELVSLSATTTGALEPRGEVGASDRCGANSSEAFYFY
jgi:hypothetical protein